MTEYTESLGTTFELLDDEMQPIRVIHLDQDCEVCGEPLIVLDPDREGHWKPANGPIDLLGPEPIHAACREEGAG